MVVVYRERYVSISMYALNEWPFIAGKTCQTEHWSTEHRSQCQELARAALRKLVKGTFGGYEAMMDACTEAGLLAENGNVLPPSITPALIDKLLALGAGAKALVSVWRFQSIYVLSYFPPPLY